MLLEATPQMMDTLVVMLGIFITLFAVGASRYLVLAVEEQKRHNQVMERLFTEIRDRLP
jgi:hypothetical protein